MWSPAVSGALLLRVTTAPSGLPLLFENSSTLNPEGVPTLAENFAVMLLSR